MTPYILFLVASSVFALRVTTDVVGTDFTIVPTSTIPPDGWASFSSTMTPKSSFSTTLSPVPLSTLSSRPSDIQLSTNSSSTVTAFSNSSTPDFSISSTPDFSISSTPNFSISKTSLSSRPSDIQLSTNSSSTVVTASSSSSTPDVSSSMLYIVGLYYANWAVYASKHFPADLPPDVTHVFYAFMKPNPSTGELDSTDPWADFQLPIEDATGAVAALMALKYQRPALKVVLAIGGWGTSPEFRAVTKDPAKLRTFVSSTTEKVRRLGFDGVDIDWEYPETAKEVDQLVSMLRQLRAAFDAVDPKLSLSVAAPAGSDKIAVLDVPAMDQYLSFWNIMCYDFVGSGWSDRTGLHSNLYGDNGDNGLNGDLAVRLYRDRGASVSKLVLGMPMYGRAFLKPAQPILGSTFAGHLSEDASLVQFHDIDRAEEVYVEKSVGAYLYNKKTKLLVTYDNEKCLARKAEYVRQNRLAGGFWWDSRGNRPRYTLVDAFVKVLRL